MTNATRSDIATARRDVEFANTEVRRWGMVVAALTGARESLRRGVAETPWMDALTRFGRVIRGDPETSTRERRKQLKYLDWETIGEGPAEGKTFLAHVGTYSWMGSFPAEMRSYVADERGTPADVIDAFDAGALSTAVSNFEADPSKFDDLVELAEAGQCAARAHRRAAIDRLNNEFDGDGNLVASGLVQSFHASATTEDVDGGSQRDPNDLNEYEALVGGMDDLPVAMLPVGLETRFVGASDDRTGDGLELWLRVYPDDVHVDAHEEELTPQEERWGQTFWTQVFVSRFPVEAPSMRSGPPKDWFLVDPESKLPDDDFYRDVLANLCYDTDEGTTLADFDADAADRLRQVKERAWGTLCERAGRERGAYVAHATAPVDHSGSNERETAVRVLTDPVPESTVSTEDVDPLEFPDVEYRPASWTKQPRARWLPDRWVATLEWTDEAGNERSATVGAPNAIREPLYLGPDPEAVASSGDGGDRDGSKGPSSTREAVDEGMEWMVEFGEAEKAGMGFRVTAEDLGTNEVPGEFDRVSVFGVKASMDPAESAEALSDLFDVHHYTRGLELLPEGAQTNNHEGSSGYRRNEDHVDSVSTEVGGPLTEPGDPSDGNLLAELLGIGTDGGDGSDHPFAHVEGADRTDWFESYNVQSALWAGTLGNYLKQMLLPERVLAGNHTDAERDRYQGLLAGVREHFLRYVRGGGPLPALRIGEQPYGVLPATAIAAHRDSGPGDQRSVYRFLLETVKLLRELWEGSLGNVDRVGADRGGPSRENSEKSALERVLEVDAVSNAYHRRLQFVDNGTRGRDYRTRSKAYDTFGIGFQPRILRMEYADAPQGVENRTLVANRGDWNPVPPVASPSDTYLDRLSRLSTGDLVRLGYDYYPERLHTFEEIYDGRGSIGEWDHLSGLFEGIRDALYAWEDDGTKPSQVTRLQGLFCPATDETDFFSIDGVPGSVAEDELGLDLGSYDGNADAVVLLYVDALDEWLGRLPADQRREVPLEQFSGGTFGGGEPETAKINTSAQDGHEQTLPGLDELRDAILDHVKLKARSMQSDWGPGMGNLKQLWDAICMGVAMNYGGTILVGTDYSIEWEKMSVGGGLSGSGAFVEQGGVFDLDPSKGELSGDMLRAAEKYNQLLFDMSWGTMESLIRNYTVDYLTLALLFKSQSSNEMAWSWDSFRDAGADAIVRGGAPLRTKLDRDLSLFGTLSWFSAVNENLDALRRMDGRFGPESHAIGNQRGRDYTAYELFDRSTPTAVQQSLGWNADSDPDHELATEFGADDWFGFLDAMRSDRYVGHDGTDDRFAAFHASLRWLNDADLLDRPDEFERAVSSVLDLSSHRLDAWWTSLATRRLDRIRSGANGDQGSGLMDVDLSGAWVDAGDGSTPSYEFDAGQFELAGGDGDDGTYLGAYGFVEDLVHEEQGSSREEFEYVQAPSVSHARTAAILQSGYESNPDESFQEKMQVDLSPKRVSNAQTVLRGLREGLWLGEMLGYFLERRIHEVSQERSGVDLEPYISTFREEYPLTEGKIHGRGSGAGDRTMNVTDGYALYQDLLNEGVAAVVSTVGVSGRDRDATVTIFEEMDEVIDAVADLLTAENVHQLQQGNYSQAGRSLSALAEGKIPRAPELTRTIRDTTGLTHRVLALTGLGDGGTGADLKPPKPWRAGGKIETPKVAEDGSLVIDQDTNEPVESADQFVVRSDAAPVVNELAGRLFPDPATVHCVATFEWESGSGDDATSHAVDHGVTLSDLELSPLDALYLTQRGGQAGGSKLESHVAYHALRHRPANRPPIPKDADVTVDFERRPQGADETDLTFGEFVELSRSLRDLIGEGRPADATDFAHPGDDTGPRAVTSHLSTRADRARDRLENVEAVLDNRLRTFGSGGEGTGNLSNSTFADTTDRVQRIQDSLSAFADAAHVASAEEVAEQLDGRTFLDELRRIENRLPAGPADREAADRAVLLEPGSGTIEGTIPVASDGIDVYLPPEPIEMSGHYTGNRVAVWVRNRAGDDLLETSATERGTDWHAEFDASELVGPEHPVRIVEVEVGASDGEVTGFGGDGDLQGSLGTEFTAAIVPRALLGPLRSGTFTLEVSIQSQSAAARLSRTARNVRVDGTGTYAAEMNLADAVPGTPFQVVVAAETRGAAPDVEPDPATGVDPGDGSGERIVLDTMAGRVVGSSPDGFDQEFLEGLSAVPRVLWLTANADAYDSFEPDAPIDELSSAVLATDWESVRHEVALMPETRTTFDADERDAVEALVGIQSVDFDAIEGAVNGGEDARGIATVAERIGLPKAITLVGTDAPYGSEQTIYPAADPMAKAQARARIRAFRRDPRPDAGRYLPDQLRGVNAELIEFVQRKGVGLAFLYFVVLVSDPAWNATTLSLVTDDPGGLIRGVDDLLYHPEAVSPREYRDTLDRFEAAAASAQSAEDRSVIDRLESFEYVDDHEQDFGAVADFVRTLREFTPVEADGTDEPRRFVEDFDDAANDLDVNLAPIVTADRGHDVADAFREGTLETLRRVMVRAAYFGVYGAMPGAAAGDSRTAARNLVRQAEDVLKRTRERLAAEAAAGEDANGTVERVEARLSALFDDDFQVLPPFEPANPREVARTFGDGGLTDANEAGPLPVETWLGRSARVREKVRMLRETLTYADAVNGTDLLALDVGQFPYYPGDDWVGIDGVRPNESDRVSVVAHAGDGFLPTVKTANSGGTPRVAGLFVDEWVEEIPAESETTGVAFRYDDPGNRPPQSILLGVPPERPGDARTDATAGDTPGEAGPWTIRALHRTISETAEMAKYRAVDLPALDPGGEASTERIVAAQLLPGLLFPQDTHVGPNHPEVDLTVLERFRQELESTDLGNLTVGSMTVEGIDATTVRTFGDYGSVDLSDGGEN